MLSLNKAGTGKYKIVSINSACHGAKRRLTTLGVFTGDEIEITKPAPGPVIFKKNGSRIGVGQGMSVNIMVEEIAGKKS